MEKDRKQRSPTFAENLRSYFSQFCSSTTIHGFRYIGERGRFAIESAIWVVIIVGMCYGCIFFMFKTYNKWVTTPVIVTLSTTETPIWEIPFPAITICPEIKANPEIFNYTDVVLKKFLQEQLTEDEKKGFESMSLICDGGTIKSFFGDDFGSLFVDDAVIINLLKLFAGSFNHSSTSDTSPIPYTWWLNTEMSADSFSIIPTNLGFCYTFNMLNISEILRSGKHYMMYEANFDTNSYKWSLDNGYFDKNVNESYPRRTFLSGIEGGVRFLLRANHSYLDYSCGGILQGFKAMIHNPAELPNTGEFFQISLDGAMLVGIRPNMLKMSEELRDYTPQDRKCYFSYERPLKYFKNYTQKNCLQECLSNYTLLNCKCIGFYMPKDDSSRTCGIASKGCLEYSAVTYLENEDKDNKCDCLPSCTSVAYDVEMFQANLFWKEKQQIEAAIRGQFPDPDALKNHISALLIYFKEKQFLSSERHELYGLVDFFANIGGILGLFIGFSVTSAVEILYFLSLRLGCNIIKFGKTLWSGDSLLLDAKKPQQHELVSL